MVPQRVNPGPGQESVWDYPRPPRVESCDAKIEVIFNQVAVAQTEHSFRVLETSHPPVYYLPRESIRMDLLKKSNHGSFCEWKGHAHYYCLLLDGQLIEDVAWSYETPTARFLEIAGCLAFYPSKADACYVNGERVRAQQGDFYGGWITNNIVGPFKGGPGTRGW